LSTPKKLHQLREGFFLSCPGHCCYLAQPLNLIALPSLTNAKSDYSTQWFTSEEEARRTARLVAPIVGQLLEVVPGYITVH
jgi:hypothetical protein